MKPIDEMLNLALLTPEQHHQISAWIADADSPEEILKMPAPCGGQSRGPVQSWASTMTCCGHRYSALTTAHTARPRVKNVLFPIGLKAWPSRARLSKSVDACPTGHRPTQVAADGYSLI